MDEIIEQADWFGKTGLSEEIERELPAYIRREFSMYEEIEKDEGLRACDFKYLGFFELTSADFEYEDTAFYEESQSIYVWDAHKYEEPLYGYVIVQQDGSVEFSAGDYLPENAQGK